MALGARGSPCRHSVASRVVVLLTAALLLCLDSAREAARSFAVLPTRAPAAPIPGSVRAQAAPRLGSAVFAAVPLDGRHVVGATFLRAVEAEVMDAEMSEGKQALVKLEETLEQQIEAAKDGDNPNRVRDLGRLLVLAKTAEGMAAAELASDASSSMQTAVAASLTEFVGKEDYNFEDVTKEVNTRMTKAVAALDDIYVEDIARELDLASQAAVASFTGKEEYEFGDISKTIADKATSTVSSFTGKEDYKFGDITKEAAKRGGDAVKQFTGKEEYKFGDITKAAFKKVFGGGD